jgi:hypothetical protein
VLGVSTTRCDLYLTSHIKYGAKNDGEQVRRLQTFLNQYEGESLPITGFYGPMTRRALERFQSKYFEDILLPWQKVGLHPDGHTPTGYAYLTTIRHINNMVCPELSLPMPSLQ